MKFKLKDLKPNPHRDLQLNPLRESKIESLRESIRETGFWNNVLVRPSDKCIAYGHNRVEAAIREGIIEANFIVRETDDDEMLKIMSRENEEGYGGDFITTVESVRALLQAYGAGKLKHPEKLMPAEKTKEEYIRYAPSVIIGVTPCDTKLVSHPYTILQVADFLGFTFAREDGRKKPQDKVIAAMRYLELRELGIWDNIHVLDSIRTVSGVIPIERVIAMANADEIKAAEAAERARIEAERAKGVAITAKQMVEQVKAVAQKKEEEVRAVVAAALQGTEGASKEKTKAQREAIEVQRETQREGNKAVKAAIKVAVKAEKQYEDAEDKLQNAAVLAEKNRETQHKSKIKTAIDGLRNMLSSGDAQYVRLREIANSNLTVDTDRSLLMLELRNLSARAQEFNLYPVKSTPKGEK